MRMFGFWRSVAAFRVRIALNLKGIAVTETMIDLDAGQQRSDAYREINPGGSVPTLFTDEETGPHAGLYQSLAIIEYLDETHPEPPLLPGTPRGRARVRALALLLAADHHPLIVPRIRGYLRNTLAIDEAAEHAWIRHWMGEGLRIIEERLEDDPETGRFCHGDTPGLADICLAAHAATARIFGVEIDRFPTASGIVARCMALDAFSAAQPLRQPGAPKAG